MTKLRWYVILTGLLLSLHPLHRWRSSATRRGVSAEASASILTRGSSGSNGTFGNFSRRVRLQPNFELGFGDNSTLGNLTIPVHYRFGSSPDFTPYAGGGILLGYIDYDKPKGSGDSDWFIEPVGVVGIEWPLSGGGDLFLELGVSFGDAHDAKLIIGWMRRIR